MVGIKNEKVKIGKEIKGQNQKTGRKWQAAAGAASGYTLVLRN